MNFVWNILNLATQAGWQLRQKPNFNALKKIIFWKCMTSPYSKLGMLLSPKFLSFLVERFTRLQSKLEPIQSVVRWRRESMMQVDISDIIRLPQIESPHGVLLLGPSCWVRRMRKKSSQTKVSSCLAQFLLLLNNLFICSDFYVPFQVDSACWETLKVKKKSKQAGFKTFICH